MFFCRPNWTCDDDGGRRTWASADVVESELSDAGVKLEEEGERLSNATSGTEDSDLRELFELC